MPDILKNSFLEGSALSLVPQVQEIDEIWAILKAARGNHKLLRKKKISEISRISQLWKLKDPEKCVEALSQIMNQRFAEASIRTLNPVKVIWWQWY